MEVFYYLVFGVLGLVVAALELSKNNKDRINTSSAFNSFKNNYLLVYSLMMGTNALPHFSSSFPLFVWLCLSKFIYFLFRSDLVVGKMLLISGFSWEI